MGGTQSFIDQETSLDGPELKYLEENNPFNIKLLLTNNSANQNNQNNNPSNNY